jgi:hypothetical protein
MSIWLSLALGWTVAIPAAVLFAGSRFSRAAQG